MGEFTINQPALIDAIIAANVSSVAKEEGAELAEAWVRQFLAHDSTNWKIRAVELGFSIWLDAHTLIVGVQDLIAEDEHGVFGGEWKTAKEPRKQNGKDSWWWNEDVWIRDRKDGAQIAIYALALNRGTYYVKPTTGEGSATLQAFHIANPRMLIRATVKSSPARFWPTDPTNGLFQFSSSSLNSLESSLRASANQIRAARRAGLIPWQWTGRHCYEFGRYCPHYESICSIRKYPIFLDPSAISGFDRNDPAYPNALAHMEIDWRDPELVILSASAYETAGTCMEKYRLQSSQLVAHEESKEMGVGTVLHAGAGEMYRQLKRFQESQ